MNTPGERRRRALSLGAVIGATLGGIINRGRERIPVRFTVSPLHTRIETLARGLLLVAGLRTEDDHTPTAANRILEPLGMSQTGFVYTPSMAKKEAFGTLPLVHLYTPLLPGLLDTSALIHKRQGKLLWLNRVYIDATPSTGLIGPSTDIAHFMIAYLNHGSLDGNLLLQPESVSLLTGTPPIDGHALGWSVGESNNALYLEHAGGGPGFATIMRLYPEKGMGFAILANGTDLDREGLMDMLANMEW